MRSTPLNTGASLPLSLLVVDDSAADRELASIALEAAFEGADVHQCANPLLAEQVCADRQFDCVMLDYNMPQMNGLELANRLRERFAHLPLVLMTSVGDEMLATEALRGGVSDYMPKMRISTESIRRTIDRSIQTCRQARIIQEQRAELENFAYALAHDFKQPIRQISTFTQLISEEIVDAPGDVQQHLGYLGDAARRLSKLVDVMVEYTLLNQPPAIAAFSLGAAIKTVRASIAPYLAERGGELIAASAPAMVLGNETLMIQVLQNLIVNGLMYNQSPAPRVEIRVSSAAEYCLIEVEDNGLGIEAEYLAEIFKPLFRLHTASQYAGTGLGLTLARKAMLAQSGSIWCESVPGTGSVFHIVLPAAAATAADPIRSRSRRARPANRLLN